MGESLNTYLAFFNGREREIKAPSSFFAHRLAIEAFKPRTSQKHMVHVHLVATPRGEVVISTASI